MDCTIKRLRRVKRLVSDVQLDISDETSHVGPFPIAEIPCSALPRFQHINSISGVISSALQPSFVREFLLTAPHPATGQPVHIGYLLQADNTSWMSKFQSGTTIELLGTLTVHLVVVVSNAGNMMGGVGVGSDGAGLRVESLSFESRGHTEYLPRESLIGDRSDRMDSETMSTSTPADTENSPSAAKRRAITKRGGGVGSRRRSQTKDEEEEQMPDGTKGSKFGENSYERSLPVSPVGSFGITEMGMRCLEVSITLVFSLVDRETDVATSLPRLLNRSLNYKI